MLCLPTVKGNGTLAVIATSLCACRFVASVPPAIRNVTSDLAASDVNRVIVTPPLGVWGVGCSVFERIDHVSISASGRRMCDIGWLRKVKLGKDRSRLHTDRLVSGRRRVAEENGPSSSRRR